MKSELTDTSPGGPISWMARHRVAANLLMVFCLFGGLMTACYIKKEVFPEFDLDLVVISVPYPGATPADVEQGIILALEEAVQGLDGVKEVSSVASEGGGSVTVELLMGTDPNRAVQDIKNAVDRITTFPEDAEEPTVSLPTTRHEVISLALYGDQDHNTLRLLAERVREELLSKKEITYVSLSGVRPLEIGVEIPQSRLREYGLTLSSVAREIRDSALDLPAGRLKTPGGEVLLRTSERRDYASEFARIPVVKQEDGTTVYLDDIAEVTDGYADSDVELYYDGLPAVMVHVYRTGRHGPVEIAALVKEYAKELSKSLPEGVMVDCWNDNSEIYSDRVHLLFKNASIGLVLVLIMLGLFLDAKLAFWVTMGIPTSFMGAMLFLPLLGVSINMISLFAFIMALGIVVDDAIVVGENIYDFRQKGCSLIEAAIRGTRQVAVPVTFSILTNMAAFAPLLFITGIFGKIFGVIPIVVIAAFTVSLIEALFILPSHLGHSRPMRADFMFRHRFDAWLSGFIEHRYGRFLSSALSVRYLSLAVAVAVMVITIGLIKGKRILISRFPRVESDVVLATATLPYGAPVEDTRAVQKMIVQKVWDVAEANGGKEIVRGVLGLVGLSYGRHEVSNSGGHVAQVIVYMVSSDKRKVGAGEFVRQWRQAVGKPVGVDSVMFQSTFGGPSGGAAIDVELSHSDINVLESAAERLADELDNFTGLTDVDDGFLVGKPELEFKVRPQGASLGLTAMEVGRQVRSAFYGVEALRQQRGRNEVKVMVRYPESDRVSEFAVEDMVIRTPSGGEIPLLDAASVSRDRSFTRITRMDGRRVVNVTAEADTRAVEDVMDALKKKVLPGLIAEFPGLSYSFAGEQKEFMESMSTLIVGFVVALLVIFTMLAIPFRSYMQPVIIMTSIPFGIIGAALGHFVMGYDISIISMMGVVALSGVVVNDSLILVDAANHRRLESGDAFDSIAFAGKRRFRPIMLTSLTTFFGLAPMIFETSMQAKFMVPMAISLGFGILFATAISLLIVPCLYLVIEDVRGLKRR